MEVLIIMVTISMFCLGMTAGINLEEPKFICADCDKEIAHDEKFCRFCGKEKKWETVTKSDKALPIFMGKWRIKI